MQFLMCKSSLQLDLKHTKNRSNFMEDLGQKMYRSLTLTFFIRQSRASQNTECMIYARLTISGQRVELSTGLKVEVEKWSKDQHKVKGNNNSARLINTCLEEFI